MDDGQLLPSSETVSEGTPVGDGGALTTEAIFETLSNRRRRYALHYLGQVAEPVTIRDLSEQVAAWEHHVDCSAVTPKLRKRVYTAFHQTHLPKMHREGIVDFDTDRGTVRLTAAIDQFDIYLDVVPADAIPWSQYYLAIGAAFTALATVGAVGLWPFSAVDGFVYALVTALAVAVLGASHTLRDREILVGAPSPSGEITPPKELEEDLTLPRP
jgi:DNA-binding transcriptional ArsR family regulator